MIYGIQVKELMRQPGNFNPYWFPLNGGIGIGVTAYSEEEAFTMAIKCSKEYFESKKVNNPVVGIKVSELDQEHVVPNMGPITLRGVWYPNVNL